MILAPDAGLGLATSRLLLRRFTWDDISWLNKLNADESVMEFLGGPMSRVATEEFFQNRVMNYYDAHSGFGCWVTIEKSSEHVVGLHCLNDVRGEALTQVGYRLFPEFWGKGYATEMSKALIYYGFSRMHLESICGITELGNSTSQRVLEKCGLARQPDRAFKHPHMAPFGELAFFSARASEWVTQFKNEFSQETYDGQSIH